MAVSLSCAVPEPLKAPENLDPLARHPGRRPLCALHAHLGQLVRIRWQPILGLLPPTLPQQNAAPSAASDGCRRAQHRSFRMDHRRLAAGVPRRTARARRRARDRLYCTRAYTDDPYFLAISAERWIRLISHWHGAVARAGIPGVAGRLGAPAYQQKQSILGRGQFFFTRVSATFF